MNFLHSDFPGSIIVLDLYCCAGGAARGYQRAGFEPFGVDIKPQPHYPGWFHQGDVIDVMRRMLEGEAVIFENRERTGWRLVTMNMVWFIHASPPCQLFCMYRNVKSVQKSTDEKYLNMIPATRPLLEASGKPYIMENVVPRYWARGDFIPDFLDRDNTIQLCGTTFGTRVRRHRLFELGGWKHLFDNIDEEAPAPKCEHWRFRDRIFPGSSNRPNGRTVCNVGEWRVPLDVQKEHMLVDWDVTMEEVSEMVPPVMTEYLGKKMYRWLDR